MFIKLHAEVLLRLQLLCFLCYEVFQPVHFPVQYLTVSNPLQKFLCFNNQRHLKLYCFQNLIMQDIRCHAVAAASLLFLVCAADIIAELLSAALHHAPYHRSMAVPAEQDPRQRINLILFRRCPCIALRQPCDSLKYFMGYDCFMRTLYNDPLAAFLFLHFLHFVIRRAPLALLQIAYINAVCENPSDGGRSPCALRPFLKSASVIQPDAFLIFAW